ncbi:MAG: LysM peptidoglycan-binding domain-containing protein [Luteolibacter sp.]
MKPTMLLATLTLAAVTTFTQAAQESAYTVKKGDSIERIANKTGVSVPALSKANDLKPGAIIHPGQQLKIPGRAATPAPAAASKPKAAPVAAVEKPAASGKRYAVNQGDTFYSISRKHGIPVSALMAANPGVKANSLRPGMTLNLGKSGTPTATPAPRKETPAPAAVAKTPEKKIAVEKPAEKPASEKIPAIVERPAEGHTDKSVEKNSVVTKVGDTLPDVQHAPPSVPLTPSSSPTTTPLQTAAASPVAQEAVVAPLKKETARPITIDGEMTYGQFAQKHNTNPARLNELNGLDLTDSTLLAKGSELYIPAQP